MKNHSHKMRSFTIVAAMLLAGSVLAASAAKLDLEANEALDVFREDVCLQLAESRRSIIQEFGDLKGRFR